MGIINPDLPTPGDPRGHEETDMRNALAALLTEFNGGIENANVANNTLAADKLVSALREALGLNSTGVVRRGKSIAATEHTRASTSYGPLSGTSGVDATDEVRDVVLPTDGLIFVHYTALAKSSALNAGRAALFLNDAVVVRPIGTGGFADSEAVFGSTANDYDFLTSIPNSGLLTIGGAGNQGRGTSPLLADGPVLIEAAAGTYDVAVRWRATSGSVTAKERNLRVWTKAF